MEPISLYKFGGSEEVLRRIQAPLVRFFRGYAPVLDIGCGRGVFLGLLSGAGIASIGIDHSEEALAACRAKGLSVHRQDGRDYLGQNHGKFGGIFCSHVIEHMAYDDAIIFLNLCRGALRHNGIILLITPN
ncbi:MAG: class I SAM-dependent methyltransferase, partial [Terriglobales bacterium]